MQQALFNLPTTDEQFVDTVKVEHAECERVGFDWQRQQRLLGGDDYVCSRCGTRRPYTTAKDHVAIADAAICSECRFPYAAHDLQGDCPDLICDNCGKRPPVAVSNSELVCTLCLDAAYVYAREHVPENAGTWSEFSAEAYAQFAEYDWTRK